MSRDLLSLPEDLPVPTDDGACEHLQGAEVPDVWLPSTRGRTIRLKYVALRPTVLFFYPRTGRPDEAAPDGWDQIPGARGCTPQSCAYRDLYAEFQALGVGVYGVSTQTTEYQREFVERNHVPYEMLSDSALVLTSRLQLPTFDYPVRSGGPSTLIRRMSWLLRDGRITTVWYPVFPPNSNAEEVLNTCRSGTH